MFDNTLATTNAFARLHLEPWIYLGDTLLVGEGNLSFAKTLLDRPMACVSRMIATTYETSQNLSNRAIKNSDYLQWKNAIVLHDVDAMHLEKIFEPSSFDSIIFQFPNVSSRNPKYGHNPNHILIRNFLRSALPYLKEDGKVIITTVDSPYYEGVFQFDEAAKFAEYNAPESHPFDPKQFSGYSHTNTNDEKSAIEDHKRFITRVFKPKK